MPVFLGGKITAITAITTLFHSTVKQSLKALQADHVLVTESAERRSDRSHTPASRVLDCTVLVLELCCTLLACLLVLLAVWALLTVHAVS